MTSGSTFGYCGGLLEKGEVKEALAYLEDYEDSMAEAIQPPLCENFVADILCRRYEVLTKQAGIEVSISAALPKEPGVAGIASVRAMAARYGGMADFTYTPDTFTAPVLLYTGK